MRNVYYLLLLALGGCLINEPTPPTNEEPNYLGFEVFSGAQEEFVRTNDGVLNIGNTLIEGLTDRLILQPQAQYIDLYEGFDAERRFLGYLWYNSSSVMGALNIEEAVEIHMGYPEESFNLFEKIEEIPGNYLVCSVRGYQLVNDTHLLVFPARINEDRFLFSDPGWGWTVPTEHQFDLDANLLHSKVFNDLSQEIGQWTGNTNPYEWLIRNPDDNAVIMHGRIMPGNFFYLQDVEAGDFYVGLQMTNTGTIFRNQTIGTYNGVLMLGSGLVQLVEINIREETLNIEVLSTEVGAGSDFPVGSHITIDGGTHFRRSINPKRTNNLGVYKNERFRITAFPLNQNSLLLVADSTQNADIERIPWIGIGTRNISSAPVEVP